MRLEGALALRGSRCPRPYSSSRSTWNGQGAGACKVKPVTEPAIGIIARTDTLGLSDLHDAPCRRESCLGGLRPRGPVGMGLAVIEKVERFLGVPRQERFGIVQDTGLGRHALSIVLAFGLDDVGARRGMSS